VLEPTTQRTNAILGSTGGSNHLLEVNSPAIQTEALNCAVCLDVELRCQQIGNFASISSWYFTHFFQRPEGGLPQRPDQKLCPRVAQ